MVLCRPRHLQRIRRCFSVGELRAGFELSARGARYLYQAVRFSGTRLPRDVVSPCKERVFFAVKTTVLYLPMYLLDYAYGTYRPGGGTYGVFLFRDRSAGSLYNSSTVVVLKELQNHARLLGGAWSVITSQPASQGGYRNECPQGRRPLRQLSASE